MTSFMNLMSNAQAHGIPAHVSRIKAWTRAALPLEPSTIISVNEIACGQPDCPPRQVVVLILRSGQSALKYAIHKSLLDTTEEDIRNAIKTSGLFEAIP
nr:hypothetical protein [uncultured Cohaesibacter sp.]